ncbi:MAG: DNRLRE domain-containing protein, partial [Candidatus Poseidoniales archaeon]|nr:DNRLRE domain-containing protein [Candidatus Poseidoniales archaeon]
MSTNTRNRRKIASSLLMVMMFLFADLSVPQAVSDWTDEELEDTFLISQTTSTMNLSKDTAIDSANSNSNYGSDETVDLGFSMFGESRILISFNNTVPSGDMVNGATLDLTCGVDPLEIGSINIFTSRMKKTWNESTATWNGPDSGSNWGLNGADDVSDHGTWEPPFYGYANNTFALNVTAIVQDAVINSRNTIDILIAATGTSYSCHMSESMDTNSRPSLSVTHQNGTHTTGGSLVPNFVEDGAALMDETQFILSAASNPELSWESSTGTQAQVQLSLSPEFKSDADDTWYYNT